jgi:tetratricopeptide (TPR) repeat protein
MMRFTRYSAPVLLLVLSGCPQATPDAPVVPTNEVAPEVTSASVAPIASANGGPVEEVEEEVDIDAIRDTVTEAVALANDGDYDAARSELLPLLERLGGAGYANYNLGVIAYLEGRESDAIDYYESALTADPALAEPLLALVRLRISDGDVSGAQRLVDAQLSSSARAPQVRAVGLYVALAREQYDGVIRDGRSILLEDEGNLDVFFAMAMAHRAEGRDVLAEYIINEAIGRDPSRIEFYFLLGVLMMDDGNMPGARSQFERVLDRVPNHAEALNNRGVLRLMSRDFQGAAADLTSAIESAPRYAEAWLNLGDAQKGLQDYSAAKRSFEEAAQIDPDYAEPWFNLGVLYLDAEMDGLTRIERLEQSLSYFTEFRERAGAVTNDHLVNAYASEAADLLAIERELERAAEEERNRPAPTEEEWGDDSGSDDSGSDDSGSDDDWGDDSGSDDDWGDDSGSDSDDDSGSDDDWGDDSGSDDDWGDDDGWEK